MIGGSMECLIRGMFERSPHAIVNKGMASLDIPQYSSSLSILNSIHRL
jgi:hypothetical protein